MKVGVLGATGYAGQELVRLLKGHREVKDLYLASSSVAGKDYAAVYPQWTGQNMGVLQTENLPDLDVVFCALPHGLSAERVGGFLRCGMKVIDLGADFRLRSPQVYEEWYGLKHPEADLLPETVYGLPELYRQEIKGQSLIANPGCYPTTSLIPLVPLLRNKLLREEFLIIDAKSGVSGAGRSASEEMQFAEINENFKAYKVGNHRHRPEIEQELSRAAGRAVQVSFTPHLVPMTRGMLATIYAGLSEGVREEDLRQCWQECYGEEEFVQLLPPGVWPQTKLACGSNHVFLQLTVEQRTGRVIIVSVLDNLVKGAAGQAVQNMNIMLGWPENEGLRGIALWP